MYAVVVALEEVQVPRFPQSASADSAGDRVVLLGASGPLEAAGVFADLGTCGTIKSMSDKPASPGLVRRPLWRDPLLWVWLISLPLAYAAIYTITERTQALPAGSGEEWARTSALFLLVWSGFVIGVGLLARVAGRRVEARLVRVINGGQHPVV